MDQDWNPVIIRKKPTGKAKKAAATGGGESSGGMTEKRYEGGKNIQKTGSLYARKLDDATESQEVQHVTHDVGLRIQQGRMEKSMTQKQLAQAISERTHVIHEYETGKAIPNQQILSKIERALGIRVRPTKAKKK